MVFHDARLNLNSEIGKAIHRSADLQSAVSPACSRQVGLGTERPVKVRGGGGLQTRETAGCKHALQSTSCRATSEYKP